MASDHGVGGSIPSGRANFLRLSGSLGTSLGCIAQNRLDEIYVLDAGAALERAAGDFQDQDLPGWLATASGATDGGYAFAGIGCQD